MNNLSSCSHVSQELCEVIFKCNNQTIESMDDYTKKENLTLVCNALNVNLSFSPPLIFNCYFLKSS